MIVRDHNGNEVDLNVRQVDSSNVRWIGWPKSGEPLLIVQFNSGRYGYIGVPRQRAVACARAKSVGSYIHTRIKPKFEAVKIA